MTTRPQAVSVSHVENERTRVTEWRLVPGAETGAHVHGYDYVIVPVTPGTFRLVDPSGAERLFPLEPGRSYFRKAGVSHNVINDGDADIVFVEVELLQEG
ncbi:cupin domain-containing protein [Azospirillum sp. TSO35-2]|uniref:cupin domain-containing protein n=1 Tax=Azospirillum sp. TSO35-2 TaxID=716796 RepID=UPI000D61530E|nr:cupin domain-containing protein [Azospirillum sp. TSO35-2]PWC32740.1 cupin [Azospirillum sp. TSO35-2]